MKSEPRHTPTHTQQQQEWERQHVRAEELELKREEQRPDDGTLSSRVAPDAKGDARYAALLASSPARLRSLNLRLTP